MPVFAHSLMYHDVVAEGRWDDSGFRGRHADHYKLTIRQFEAHLQVLRPHLQRPATVVDRLDQRARTGPAPVLLTFDDGGVSAATEIAPRLEALDCRGYFFVTTDHIGAPGFLTASQIRDLHTAGHVIGSHTCSHPPRINTLPPQRLYDEWSRSRQRLEQLLGAAVSIGSIPGGAYSPAVARAAEQAGYTLLLTSEPTSRGWQVGQCTCLGRYAVTRRTSPESAAACAAGRWTSCGRQWLLWNTRKAAKRLAGPVYEPVRRALLRLA